MLEDSIHLGDTAHVGVAIKRWLQGVSSTATDVQYEGTGEDEWALYQLSSIVPIFTGGLSLIGAYIILREVIVDHKNKKGNSITRLLMSLSVADILFSSGIMMSTFVSPAGLDYIWGNIGNTETCELQGFMLLFGHIASPMFSTAVAYFYVLLVRYGYPDEALQKIEPWVHSILWLVALSIAVVPLPLGMYNNLFETCWIAEYPVDCNVDNSVLVSNNVKCERGIGASDYAHVLALIPLWPCIFMSTFIMLILYCSVRDVENQTGNFEGNEMSRMVDTRKSQMTEVGTFQDAPTCSDSEIGIDRKLLRTVAIQAAFYILAFLSTYAVYLVVHILGLNGYHSWTLGFVAKVICMPLQGKTDLLVSCSLWMCALRIVFWHSFCCRIFQLLCFCLAAGYANR